MKTKAAGIGSIFALVAAAAMVATLATGHKIPYPASLEQRPEGRPINLEEQTARYYSDWK